MRNDKIIGRFEPIGPDVGLPRKPFEVISKHEAECLGVDCKPGYHGTTVRGHEYSVIGEHWRWVPAQKTKDPIKGKAVAEMVDALGCDPEASKTAEFIRCGLLYDAGYRKFEIVDEPAAPSDGGSAFGEYKQVGAVAVQKGGMSMRDYFAAKGLQGIVSNDALLQRLALGAESIEGVTRDGAVACRAYALADAMLEERKP